MKITFLGTAGMQPTKERNATAILINHNSENILVDCGEGTQRQLKTAEIKPTKTTKILISHWHGDHILGIPGLIHTLGALEYSKTLEVYGPVDTNTHMLNLFNFFINKDKIKLKVKEIHKNGLFLETKDLLFYAIKIDHTCPTLGYIIKEKDKRKMNLPYLKKFGLTKDPILGRLQKGENITYKGQKILAKNATKLIPGKKIAIILDSYPTNEIIKSIKNSDLLIMESTFTSELKEKAKEYKHTTAEQAAKIAKKAKVKSLVLTHISKRYANVTPILKEAKAIFKNTKVANDFTEIKL